MMTTWMVNGYIYIENMKYKRDLCCITRPSVWPVGKARKSAGRRQAEIKQEAGRGLQWLVNPCLVREGIPQKI